MCGLAGFIDFRRSSDKKTLISMTDSLEHRGPDGSGYEFFKNDYAEIGLGHRRLSIIDVSEMGHQPMFNKNLCIIFNGEIYNFNEIKRDLQKLGHSFKSNSDTEVILVGYEQWGIAIVERFIGMFVFVIYDQKAQKVIICRDRIGVKPLFLYQNDGLILFASELKAFHLHPRFIKEVDMNSVGLYFRYGYVPSPHCIFKRVTKLQPGKYLEIDINTRKTKEQTYWRPLDFVQKENSLSLIEVETEIESIIKSACNYRMVADVPIGSFLSGGYDSSLVTAIIQSERTEKVNTFTIGFENANYDESKYGNLVSEYLGTNHESYICNEKEAIDIIPELCYYYDEPFADSSAIPTTLVSKIAAKKVKVALSSDGGDEVFGGYKRNLSFMNIHSKLNRVPKSLRKGIANIIIATMARSPFMGHEKRGKFTKAALMLQHVDLLHIANLYPQRMMDFEIDNLGLQRILMDPQNTFIDALEEVEDRMNSVLTFDYISTLTNDMLVKVDRATMSQSLEGREPLLDHRIYEFMASVPSSMKIRNGSLKHILKNITHKYIPKEIMERPKMGFGLPIHNWLSHQLRDYVYDTITDKKVLDCGILDVSTVQKNLGDYINNEGYSDKLWLLVQFQSWCNKWL